MAKAKWLQEFKNPKNIGILEGVAGEAGGSCADLVKIFLKVKQNLIEDASFLAKGCPAAIASASALTQIIKRKTIFEAAKITSKHIREWLHDLPKERQKCAEVVALALSRTIENYCSTYHHEKFPTNPNRVFVGLSGGVDSEIAAYLLKEQGFEVIGITARIYDNRENGKRSCCNPKDISDAKTVCEQLNLPHIVLDMRRIFKREVIDRFCRLYLSGKTPNPCVDCNRFFRFKHLMSIAKNFGANYLATGHYVRLVKEGEKILVKRAKDKSKDQSYFFWAATQETLKHFLTPVGNLTKKEVRELASNLSLVVANKKESQDICFIPEGNYRNFLVKELNLKPDVGEIVDTKGNVLGKHTGFFNFTIGQRKGLGLSFPYPVYVCGIDPHKNQVIVGRKEELQKKSFKVGELNLITGTSSTTFKAQVMLRYNSTLYPAKIELLDNREAVVIFEKETGPVCPGQSAVFYDGDTLIGGGIIL